MEEDLTTYLKLHYIVGLYQTCRCGSISTRYLWLAGHLGTALRRVTEVSFMMLKLPRSEQFVLEKHIKSKNKKV